jgi:hypothetical protein
VFGGEFRRFPMSTNPYLQSEAHVCAFDCQPG